jgi:hypothetical protein
LKIKLNQGFKLSTDHASSSYGMPVLVKGTAAYGPADIVWSNGYPVQGTGIPARELLKRLVNNMVPSRRDRLTHQQIDLIMKFIEQLTMVFRLTP